MSRTPAYRYIVATVNERDHAVAVAYDDKPGIWRVVASFATRARAEDFAEIENMFLEDDWPHETDGCRRDEQSPPSDVEIPNEPKSALVPGQIVRVKASNEVASIPAPTETDAPKIYENVSEEIVPAISDDEVACTSMYTDVHPASVDAAGLPPITPVQATVLKAAQTLLAVKSTFYVSEINRLGGPSAGSLLYTLEKKGYLRNEGQRGAPVWKIAFFGEPRVEQFRHGSQNRPRHERVVTPINVPKRRFTTNPEMAPEQVKGLREDHPALTEGRTIFPTTVIDPKDSPRLLISGANSRKLGDKVVKGPWTNFPIYQLSLEERATCPSSCYHWASCYGNGMQLARRHRATPDLVDYLRDELVDLQDDHPDGFVVRLHVLGDFFSVDYVKAWSDFLKEFPALHVFGYTAWERGSEIGAAVKRLTDTQWDRFAIRFSSETSKPQGSTTIWRKPETASVAEGIVCPAETGKTACCGSCGLCWAPAAKEKTIVFVAHGPRFKGRPPLNGSGSTIARASA